MISSDVWLILLSQRLQKWMVLFWSQLPLTLWGWTFLGWDLRCSQIHWYVRFPGLDLIWEWVWMYSGSAGTLAMRQKPCASHYSHHLLVPKALPTPDLACLHPQQDPCQALWAKALGQHVCQSPASLLWWDIPSVVGLILVELLLFFKTWREPHTARCGFWASRWPPSDRMA